MRQLKTSAAEIAVIIIGAGIAASVSAKAQADTTDYRRSGGCCHRLVLPERVLAHPEDVFQAAVREGAHGLKTVRLGGAVPFVVKIEKCSGSCEIREIILAPDCEVDPADIVQEALLQMQEIRENDEIYDPAADARRRREAIDLITVRQLYSVLHNERLPYIAAE